MSTVTLTPSPSIHSRNLDSGDAADDELSFYLGRTMDLSSHQSSILNDHHRHEFGRVISSQELPRAPSRAPSTCGERAAYALYSTPGSSQFHDASPCPSRSETDTSSPEHEWCRTLGYNGSPFSPPTTLRPRRSPASWSCQK